MFDDPIGDHIRLVETVAAAGVEATQEWRDLLDRMNAFGRLTDQTPLRDQLTAAIVGGADASMPTLRALALAEVANQAQVETVHTHVRYAVYTRMREVHSAVAADDYSQIAAKFDAVAKRFVTAASTVDVEADAVTMIEQPDKVRRSWLDAEGFANQLTRLLPAVQASAALAGIADTDADVVALPLVADLAGVHRRRAWEAWLTTTGRCGRWAALLRCGAVLRCCALSEHQWYAEPRAMEHRQQEIRNEDGRVVGTRRIEVDPEDDGHTPAPIDPRKPRGRAAFAQ